MCTVAEEQQAAARPAQQERKIKSEKNGWCWCLSSETHSKRQAKEEKKF
jgi:hypothetical protein